MPFILYSASRLSMCVGTKLLWRVGHNYANYQDRLALAIIRDELDQHDIYYNTLYITQYINNHIFRYQVILLQKTLIRVHRLVRQECNGVH